MQTSSVGTAIQHDAEELASQKSNARRRVQAFRSGGTRLDLLVSPRSARDLDRIAKSLSTSRRHIVEALIRLAAANQDLSTLRLLLDGEESVCSTVEFSVESDYSSRLRAEASHFTGDCGHAGRPTDTAFMG